MNSDPFLNRSKCVERLIKEYKKHPRLIIACDFDDTVFPFTEPDSTHNYVLDLIKQCYDRNFYIVIFTASAPERYEMITQYMADHGIQIASINKNPIELPFGNNGKIYYNHFLDDRAGLWEAANILQDFLSII